MYAATLSVAIRFAAALDTEDYDALAELLAIDCEYAARGNTLVGVAAIIASYRDVSRWARANVGSVTYESSVRVVHEGFATITFLDLLEDSGLRHAYSCEQSLSIHDDGKIGRIVHRELPGQREGVDVFLRQIGVARPSGRRHEQGG